MNKSSEALGNYTIPIETGMHVRHDAKGRFTVKSGRRVLQDELMPVSTLGGALTVAGIIYNGLSMSGGVSWCDPSTGGGIERPKVKMRVRPEDVLAEGEECGCSECGMAPPNEERHPTHDDESRQAWDNELPLP